MSKIKIPVAQVDTGLRLCAQNIRRFIEDTSALLERSSLIHATALAIFAVEELAKYSELKKAKMLTTGSNLRVDSRLFKRHEYKQKLAKSLLPKDALILSPAYFAAKYFDPKYFQTEDVEVSDALRLDCIFVNWKDGKWVYGSNAESNRLKRLAQNVLDTLTKLESSSP
jgi:AbiV family abortive infection protein